MAVVLQGAAARACIEEVQGARVSSLVDRRSGRELLHGRPGVRWEPTGYMDRPARRLGPDVPERRRRRRLAAARHRVVGGLRRARARRRARGARRRARLARRAGRARLPPARPAAGGPAARDHRDGARGRARVPVVDPSDARGRPRLAHRARARGRRSRPTGSTPGRSRPGRWPTAIASARSRSPRRRRAGSRSCTRTAWPRRPSAAPTGRHGTRVRWDASFFRHLWLVTLSGFGPVPLALVIEPCTSWPYRLDEALAAGRAASLRRR